MCRSIRRLSNYEPPATAEEVHAVARQFVRKVSGSREPSEANQDVFDTAVAGVAAATQRLVNDLVTTAAPMNREEEALKAKALAARRFA